jgi:predicted NUDIX family NTP pyrophosphohydrolase
VDRAEWMTVSEATPRLVSAQAEFLTRLVTRLESKNA